MISDVLCDAKARIEEYVRIMPKVYAELENEITIVTTVMDSLGMCLDCPDPRMGQDILDAINSIDLSELKKARSSLLDAERSKVAGRSNIRN